MIVVVVIKDIISDCLSRLTKGHIGATSFEMIVEADHTMYLVCNYTVYGVKPFQRRKRVRVESKKILFRDEL